VIRTSGTPLAGDSTVRSLIVFSHLRWGFVHRRPQHLMARLSQAYRVFFVEEPVFTAGPARLECSTRAPGLEVLVPHTPVAASGFHDDQLPLLEPLIAEFLRARDVDDCIAWFDTPMALPLLSALRRPHAVVYDCIDELAAGPDAPRQLRQREAALLKIANLVFTGGPALYAAKHDLHPNVHCLPGSADAAHFAPGGLAPDCLHAAEAERLQGRIGRPRLGFFGVIDARFDAALIAQLADARPDWQLVLAGPVAPKIDPAQLPQRPNLHWLGRQPYDRLPYLLAGWDVCLLPFALNDATRFVNPTKTLEYMAGEKPIVSTPVPDVLSLYGDTVRIAATPAEFVAACAKALAERGAQRNRRIEGMLATVYRSSWDRIALTVRRLLQDELDKLAAQPLPLQAGAVAALDLAVTTPVAEPAALASAAQAAR
jgi:UDP-galactopyranose mutase